MNCYSGELIGFETKILKSSNPLHCGLEGKIVDETKNMIYIQKFNKILKIPKKDTIFKIGKHELEGSKLMFRPYERIARLVTMEDC